MLLSIAKILSSTLQCASTFIVSTTVSSIIPNLALISVIGYSVYSFLEDIKDSHSNKGFINDVKNIFNNVDYLLVTGIHVIS